MSFAEHPRTLACKLIGGKIVSVGGKPDLTDPVLLYIDVETQQGKYRLYVSTVEHFVKVKFDEPDVLI